MTSNVQNALGAQKQFSAQPQDSYAKRLADVTRASVSTVTDDSATLLARSLGVLGTTIAEFGTDDVKRKKELALVAAEKMVAGKTDAELQSLKSIDMIQSFTDFDITDNPYAVTYMEKLRGKYIGSKVKNDYQTYKTEQGYNGILTPEQEAARYDKFVAERYGKALELTSDKEAFKQGFYDNHMVSQLEQIEAFNKHRSEEYKVLRKGETETAINELIQKAFTGKPEDGAKDADLIFRHTRLTGADILERKEYAKSLALGLAKHGINADYINHLADNVVVGVTPDGKDVKLRQALGDSLVEILDVSSVQQRLLNDERVLDAREQLEKAKSEDEIGKLYHDWKTTDQQFYITMAPEKDDYLKALKIKERKSLVGNMNANAKNNLKKNIGEYWRSNYRAYYSGNFNMDWYGNPVGVGRSALRPIKYRQVDNNMQIIEKEYHMTESDELEETKNQVAYIKKTYKDDEKALYYNLMKVAAFPLAKAWKDSLQHTFNSAFDSLTVDQLANGTDGKPMLTGHIKDALMMHRANPSEFNRQFGHKLTQDVERLDTLIKLNGDDLQAGVAAFASSRTKLEDPNIKKSAEITVDRKLESFGTLRDMVGMDGMIVNVNRSVASNNVLMSRIREGMIADVTSGMDVDVSLKKQIANANATHWVYRDTAIPKAVFGGIPVEDKGPIGKTVLDNYVSWVSTLAGVDEKEAYVTWDDARNTLEIHAGNRIQPLTANNLAWAAQEELKKQKTEYEKNKKPDYSYSQYTDDYTNSNKVDPYGFSGTD